MLCYTVAILLLGGPGVSDTTPSAKEVEVKIRENREAIRCGMIKIKNECNSYQDGRQQLIERADRQIWFDSKRVSVTWIGISPTDTGKNAIVHVCVPFQKHNL
jgi:hypothetical protein